MAYNIKLKNQIGTEVNYASVEQVNIPLSSGTGEATFLAKYKVTKTAKANITYIGGDAAAYGVDYMCRITGSAVADSVTVSVGGATAAQNTAYTYVKVSDTEAYVVVNGSFVTGDLVITA